MRVEGFFDKNTWAITYVVWDENTRDAVIIDPVLDYEPASSSYWSESVEKVMTFVKGKELEVHFILETHAHADHMTGSQELKKHLPNSKVAIGEKITQVQETFKEFFNFGKDFKTDGSQFDFLLKEGDEVQAGSLQFKVMHAPGHTPACSSYLFEDAVFTGDVLFMPDFGVARCDFPGGSAKLLYDSVHNKLYKLPDETRVFTGHDYQPGGRKLEYETTIGECKKNNIHLKIDTSEEDFVKMRTERDKILAAPQLLLPSVQVNIAAGNFPQAEDNSVSYLKLPLLRKKG